MRTILAAICLITVFASNAIDFSFHRGISYRENSADTMQVLDVAAPVGGRDLPVVVWFHGGGLTGGHREVPKALLSDSLVVVGVEYRLSPHATVDEIIDDAAAAVAWTINNIAQYGGNPAKVFVAGHSAGGYLTDMIGMDKSRLAPYGIDPDMLAGLAPFSGQCITHFEVRRLQGIDNLTPTVDNYAPLFHTRPDCPPMLIISADREQEMFGRYEEQAYMWRMLKLQGHPDVTLYEMDGYNHGNMPYPAFPLLIQWIRNHR